MQPYCVLRFRYYYQENKLKALKYVYYHNSLMILNKFFNIKHSIVYDKKLIEDQLRNKTIKGYQYTNILLCESSINDALFHFASKGHNVCAFNYANPNIPGGMYNLGMPGPEEDLCRVCPALYNYLLSTKAYPLKNKIIFSPNILLSRDSNNNYDFYKKPVNVNIVSGYSLTYLNSSILKKTIGNNAKHNKINKINNTMRRMFIIPSINGCDCIILSAWGCHDFQNDPYIIAELFCKLILKYKKLYKIICISIPKGYNHTVFSNVFKKNDLI